MGLAASQYADVPLAFFCLATLVLLCLADRQEKGRHGFLVLAGLACGMAAWTKNEGAALHGLRPAGEDLDCGQNVRRKRLLEADAAVPRRVAAGPADRPVLQIRYAPANDILDPANRAFALERLLATSRYATIGVWVLKQAFRVWAMGRPLVDLPISPVPCCSSRWSFTDQAGRAAASRAGDGGLGARSDAGRLPVRF